MYERSSQNARALLFVRRGAVAILLHCTVRIVRPRAACWPDILGQGRCTAVQVAFCRSSCETSSLAWTE